MNLLEHYIKEVHSIEPFSADWTKKHRKKYVKVDITYNCYGAIERSEYVFHTQEWEDIKRQGFFMA